MHRIKRSMLVKSRSSLMAFFTTVLLVSLGSASAGGKDPLSPGAVRPGNLDYRTELPQGYLKVYSATDEFNDGDALYFRTQLLRHLFTIDGKPFKNVKNQRFPADEIPEVVALPVGTYTSSLGRRDRYGRIFVVIKEAQQTIVDLDLWERKTIRLAHN